MKNLAMILVALLVFSLVTPSQYANAEESGNEQVAETSEVQNTEDEVTEMEDTEQPSEEQSESVDEEELSEDTADSETITEDIPVTEKEFTEEAATEEDAEQTEESDQTSTNEPDSSADEEETAEYEQEQSDVEDAVEETTEQSEATAEEKSSEQAAPAEAKMRIASVEETEIIEESTSRLGHLRHDAVIYQDLDDLSQTLNASDGYTNAVYYIKKQASLNDQLYYLISTQPSSTKGVIGWVKAEDLDSRSHQTVNNDHKTLYVTGNGSAYTKAWGGSKDLVFNLADYKNAKFEVNLTETVGNNTWYRGVLNGQTVFIHYSYVSSYVQVENEKSTSRLGHLRSDAVIYPDLSDTSDSIDAAKAGYTNAVYYVKKQAEVNDQLYYLISTQPSSTKGVVGWVKSDDLDSRTHVTVDSQAKTFIVTGNGNAYAKAWGGSKDLVYDLSGYKGQTFEVDLTEKVGNNTWYRGMLAGKKVFIHYSYLSSGVESSTSRLGHVSSNTKIYPSLMDLTSYVTAQNGGYAGQVYYIKKQSELNGTLYYLLSTKPSATSGTIGWAKASDISSNEHQTVDSKAKTFYLKGSGKAYSKAWGDSGDVVYSDLVSYEAEEFKVNLTETVGNTTWYRGVLDGKTVFIEADNVTNVKTSSTSRLGHLNASAKIYENMEDLTDYTTADTAAVSKVYYIKKQAVLDGNTYYLISSQPSSSEGVIGWVKSTDMTSKVHSSVDSKSKTFYINGSGKAYSKAWGNTGDVVYDDLSDYNLAEFKVNLTEKVGDDTWYRGTLDGKTVFIQSDNVADSKESSTSRLGHVRATAKIYPDWKQQSSYYEAEADGYTNAVYYVKKQVQVADKLFYLISTQPSSTSGVVGWVEEADLDSRTHITVDSDKKTYYIAGTGKSYSKAWGGSKDIVYSDMSGYEGDAFNINLTEKVGNNIWYRGTLNGKTMWLHESYLTVGYQENTSYNLTLEEALAIQLDASPQTDSEYKTYVSKEYINSSNQVTATTLNVRGGPSTNYWIVGTLSKGTKVTILGESGSWYEISYTASRQWVNPDPDDILYYLDPDNFVNDAQQKFQFLDLTRSSDVSAETLNNYLKGKGTLAGQGQAFIDASKLYGINDIYLVSHAILETGNGTSTLASGVKYNGTTVYNMYGIGAIDECPIDCGAKRAYEEGWTTPYKAIVGGAQFIGSSYITSGQNTLYKMRWNPEAMSNLGTFSHQYATDIGWASKQVYTMYNLYQEIGSYTLYLDIPTYK